MADDHAASSGKAKTDKADRLNALQVLAATGAATTGAVVVNLLGLFGTITGVAVLSVVSSTATVLYLKSMNHTKEKVKEVVKRPGANGDGTVATMLREPAPDQGDEDRAADETAEPAAPSTEPRKSRWGAWGVHWRTVLVTSVVVFGLSIATLTAVAWMTGQPPDAYYGPRQGATADEDGSGDDQPQYRHDDEAETPTQTPSDGSTSPDDGSQSPSDDVPTSPDDTPTASDDTPTPTKDDDSKQ
ncbi:MAG: hypothetical protein ACRDXX_06345 [Stackebrandtia sp.]